MSGKMTVKDVLGLIKKEGIEIVDLRFMDFPGMWQHFSIPAREVDEDTFENGLGFDGSASGLAGHQRVGQLVKPVPETAFVDPFFQAKSLVLICNICDPVTGEELHTGSPEHRGGRRRSTSWVPGSRTRPNFGPEGGGSSSLTTSVSTRMSTRGIFTSTVWRAGGTRAVSRNPTWVTRSGTKRATSRFHPRTASRTSGARCG